MVKKPAFIPYVGYEFSIEEMLKRSESWYDQAKKRRSIREFSNRDVPFEVVKNLLLSAGTSPSGAHKQPWTFCLVRSSAIKREIRIAAEKEEMESYQNRMGVKWLNDLKPLGTNWEKPFIETAPWLIVVFKRVYELENGEKHPNYYVNESVGIACGMLIDAIHNVGLVTLTHTPSPMNFLTKILDRPENERPFLILPIGFAAPDSQVPNLKRKTFDELVKIFD